MKLVDGRVALVAAVVLALPLSAHAQSAEAEVLFRDGRTLIKQGKLAPGCDKLAASERIEPSVGTLLNLGDCREKLGRIASAWAAFRKAESMAKRSGNDEQRRSEAAKRAGALEPRLANLVIEVKQPVAGLVVRRGDEIVDAGVWNTAVPVDPERYSVVAEAPGYKPWRIEVIVDGKSKRRVVAIPKLELAPAPIAVAVTGAPSANPATQFPHASEPPRTAAVPTYQDGGTWTTARKLAAGVAVLGVASLGGGLYLGTRARDLEDRANVLCPDAVCNNAEAVRLNRDAQDNALRANVCLIGGGAALAVATVIWFAGGPSREMVVTPSIGQRQAGLSLGGRF